MTSAAGRREDALDKALEETFPGSDPVAVGRSDHPGSPEGHGTSMAPRDSEVIDNETRRASRFELNLGRAIVSLTTDPKVT